MERLVKYFSEGIESGDLGASIGMEVETSFVDFERNPISLESSQQLIAEFAKRYDWCITQTKRYLITEISSLKSEDRIFYELGRQNIELSTTPLDLKDIIPHTRRLLEKLYCVGNDIEIKPHFGSILDTGEDLLVIPDERDAAWLELDGRHALELLARCSAVQFTIEVPAQKAVHCLNNLADHITVFLKDYPQELLWRRYIHESLAGWSPLRYGGPLFFNDLHDYCRELARHSVVKESSLISIQDVEDFDITLFLRSIWWYFRLRRYNNKLCIEIRSLGRQNDDRFQGQLDFVMDMLSL